MGALEHLTVIWGAVFAATIAARFTRLTSVLFYLLFGSFFVSFGLLPEAPSDFIRGFAEIGIILIMFALGFEENTSHFIKSIKRSWGIAFFGGLAPFLTAYFISLHLWEDQNLSLVIALAMTATAVSLTMVSLKSEGLSKSTASMGIMTSAVLDDIASLALVAIIIPIATGAATPGLAGIAYSLGTAIGFFIVIAILAAYILPTRPQGLMGNLPLIKHINIQSLLNFDGGAMAVLILLAFATGVGILAHVFGFHPAVGAYMAGLIIKEEYFTPSHKTPEPRPYPQRPYEEAKTIIDNVAFVWIGPVFFVNLGAQIQLDLDTIIRVFPNALMFFAAMFVGQTLSASFAARFTGGFDWSNSWLIGFGMLGRAELAFVVLDIGYIQHKIIPDEAFYTLMVAIFMLNISVPSCIKLWKPRVKMET